MQVDDRTNPMDKHVEVLSDLQGISAAPITPQMFAAAGIEHMEKYGERLTLNLYGDLYASLLYIINEVTFSLLSSTYSFILSHIIGTTKDHFAKIAEKNHRHSANNE